MEPKKQIEEIRISRRRSWRKRIQILYKNTLNNNKVPSKSYVLENLYKTPMIISFLKFGPNLLYIANAW
jgi:hypothetical protein